MCAFARGSPGPLVLVSALRVKIVSEIVSYLSSATSTPKLTSFHEACVPVRPNYSLVQFRTADVVNAILCRFMCVVSVAKKVIRSAMRDNRDKEMSKAK